MTVEKLIEALYGRAKELDEDGFHVRAHELRAMVRDVISAHDQVRDWKPKRKAKR